MVKVILSAAGKLVMQKVERMQKEFGSAYAIATNKKISILLDQWVKRNFTSEGKLAGGWKKLKLGGRWKRGQFDRSAKILQDTRALNRSFLPFSDKNKAGIGSKLFYSADHEYGVSSRRLPIRRMLPVGKDIKEAAEKVVSNEWKRLKNDSGLI